MPVSGSYLLSSLTRSAEGGEQCDVVLRQKGRSPHACSCPLPSGSRECPVALATDVAMGLSTFVAGPAAVLPSLVAWAFAAHAATLKLFPAGLLSSLSELAALTHDEERLIDNQTREEIIPVALSSGQQSEKYESMCRYLVRSGAFSGAGDSFSTSQLAYGSVVLRDICFNHSFVSLVKATPAASRPAIVLHQSIAYL